MALVEEHRNRLSDAIVQAVLRELQAGLAAIYREQIPALVVYGSYARGEATEDSDLDLLLLFWQPVNASREISRLSPLLAELNLRHGVLLSVFPATVGEYERAEGPFWRNVRREGVGIDGP